MPLDQPALLLATFVALNYVSVMAHELGHALLARRVGYRVTACGLGFGRPLLRWRLGGTVYYAGWRRPFQGLTFSLATRAHHDRRDEVHLLVGGVVGHLALIAAIVPLFLLTRHWLLQLALWLNGAYLLLGLLPIRFRVGGALIESDARRILQLLRGRRHRSSPGGRLRTLTTCVTHLEQIGDPVGASAYRTELALLELECDRRAEAEALLEPPPPAEAPGHLHGRHALARYYRARALQDDADAERQLSAAATHFAQDADAALMIELARLEAPLTPPPAPEAPVDPRLPAICVRLEQLADADPPRWAASYLRQLRVRAATLAGDRAAADRLADDDRVPDWLRAWVDARRALAERDRDRAAEAYQRLLDAIAGELGSLPAGEARLGLLRHSFAGAEIEALAADHPGLREALDHLRDDPRVHSEVVQSTLGQLGLSFVVVGVLCQSLAAAGLAAWSAERLTLLMVTAASLGLAGFAAGLLGLVTRDRKRSALLAVAGGAPLALWALGWLVQLR